MNRLVSIILPSRLATEDISGLMSDLGDQKKDFEIEVIRISGVAPPSAARNKGAGQAKGEILIFIDADIRLGSDMYLDNLVRALVEADDIGAVCASLRLPPGSSGFQKLYVRQIAHYEMPIVDIKTPVDMVPSACFAIRRGMFFDIGKFNEKMIRGEDSELSLRIKKTGARLVLSPQTWCYHPAPNDLFQLAGINFRNGNGVCFVDTFYPELNIDVHPKGILYPSAKISFWGRIKRFILALARALIEFKILALLAKLFYVSGYLRGFIVYRIIKRP